MFSNHTLGNDLTTQSAWEVIGGLLTWGSTHKESQ